MRGELFRFVLVGLFNTAFGYVLFIGFLWGVGLNEFAASAAAYLIAVIVSFFLTSKFVFNHVYEFNKFAKFMICFMFSLGANQFVLLFFSQTGLLRPEIAQIFGMGTYTIMFFALNKWLVFGNSSTDVEHE